MRSGPHVARVLRRHVNIKQPSANMDYSASNELKQLPYHKPSSLGSLEQTFSPSFLGRIDDEFYSDTATTSDRPPSMRISIALEDNTNAKTKMVEMQQRIRSVQDENKKKVASVFRYDMKEIQVKLSNLSTIVTAVICQIKS